MMLKEVKYNEMSKSEVLNNLANIKKKWSCVNDFIEGLPSHWFKKPVTNVMKIDIDFHNTVINIEKQLKLRLKDIYFNLDIKELNDLLIKSNFLNTQEISLQLELQDNEIAYVVGEKTIENENGDLIKVSPSVINYTIKDIKEDIKHNRDNIKKIEQEEKAMALLLRKKYF